MDTFESFFFLFEMACVFLPLLKDPFSCHTCLFSICIFLALFSSSTSFWGLDLVSAPYFFEKERMVLGILDFAEGFVLHFLLLDDLLRSFLEKIYTILHLLLSINQQSFHLNKERWYLDELVIFMHLAIFAGQSIRSVGLKCDRPELKGKLFLCFHHGILVAIINRNCNMIILFKFAQWLGWGNFWGW